MIANRSRVCSVCDDTASMIRRIPRWDGTLDGGPRSLYGICKTNGWHLDIDRMYSIIYDGDIYHAGVFGFPSTHQVMWELHGDIFYDPTTAAAVAVALAYREQEKQDDSPD